MDLSAVVRDLNEDPHRPRSFYEYPALYDFYHSRALDREAQVRLLRRFEPAETDRVLEFGCGTGPLLARIEAEYEAVLGVDANEAMLETAAERLTSATVRRADVTEWSAADEGWTFDAAVLFGGLCSFGTRSSISWESDAPPKIVDGRFEDHLAELQPPASRTHGGAERALDA